MKVLFRPASDAFDPDKKEFYTKTGHLTRYAFLCGYYEQYTSAEQTDRYVGCLGMETKHERIAIVLYMESGRYFVKYVVYEKCGTLKTIDMYSSDTLTEARRIVKACSIRAEHEEA